MTIELSNLVYDVRMELSAMPDDMLETEQIHKEIKKANLYINYLIDPDWEDEDVQSQAIVSLAAYYSYVNYMSLISLQRDDISSYVYQRERVLRQIALTFMKQLSKFPLSEDLSIDDKLFEKMGTLGLVNTSNIWS